MKHNSFLGLGPPDPQFLLSFPNNPKLLLSIQGNQALIIEKASLIHANKTKIPKKTLTQKNNTTHLLGSVIQSISSLYSGIFTSATIHSSGQFIALAESSVGMTSSLHSDSSSEKDLWNPFVQSSVDKTVYLDKVMAKNHGSKKTPSLPVVHIFFNAGSKSNPKFQLFHDLHLCGDHSICHLSWLISSDPNDDSQSFSYFLTAAANPDFTVNVFQIDDKNNYSRLAQGFNGNFLTGSILPCPTDPLRFLTCGNRIMTAWALSTTSTGIKMSQILASWNIYPYCTILNSFVIVQTRKNQTHIFGTAQTPHFNPNDIKNFLIVCFTQLGHITIWKYDTTNTTNCPTFHSILVIRDIPETGAQYLSTFSCCGTETYKNKDIFTLCTKEGVVCWIDPNYLFQLAPVAEDSNISDSSSPTHKCTKSATKILDSFDTKQNDIFSLMHWDNETILFRTFTGILIPAPSYTRIRDKKRNPLIQFPQSSSSGLQEILKVNTSHFIAFSIHPCYSGIVLAADSAGYISLWAYIKNPLAAHFCWVCIYSFAHSSTVSYIHWPSLFSQENNFNGPEVAQSFKSLNASPSQLKHFAPVYTNNIVAVGFNDSTFSIFHIDPILLFQICTGISLTDPNELYSSTLRSTHEIGQDASLHVVEKYLMTEIYASKLSNSGAISSLLLKSAFQQNHLILCAATSDSIVYYFNIVPQKIHFTSQKSQTEDESLEGVVEENISEENALNLKATPLSSSFLFQPFLVFPIGFFNPSIIHKQYSMIFGFGMPTDVPDQSIVSMELALKSPNIRVLQIPVLQLLFADLSTCSIPLLGLTSWAPSVQNVNHKKLIQAQFPLEAQTTQRATLNTMKPLKHLLDLIGRVDKSCLHTYKSKNIKFNLVPAGISFKPKYLPNIYGYLFNCPQKVSNDQNYLLHGFNHGLFQHLEYNASAPPNSNISQSSFKPISQFSFCSSLPAFQLTNIKPETEKSLLSSVFVLDYLQRIPVLETSLTITLEQDFINRDRKTLLSSMEVLKQKILVELDNIRNKFYSLIEEHDIKEKGYDPAYLILDSELSTLQQHRLHIQLSQANNVLQPMISCANKLSILIKKKFVEVLEEPHLSVDGPKPHFSSYFKSQLYGQNSQIERSFGHQKLASVIKIGNFKPTSIGFLPQNSSIELSWPRIPSFPITSHRVSNLLSSQLVELLEHHSHQPRSNLKKVDDNSDEEVSEIKNPLILEDQDVFQDFDEIFHAQMLSQDLKTGDKTPSNVSLESQSLYMNLIRWCSDISDHLNIPDFDSLQNISLTTINSSNDATPFKDRLVQLKKIVCSLHSMVSDQPIENTIDESILQLEIDPSKQDISKSLKSVNFLISQGKIRGILSLLTNATTETFSLGVGENSFSFSDDDSSALQSFQQRRSKRLGNLQEFVSSSHQMFTKLYDENLKDFNRLSIASKLVAHFPLELNNDKLDSSNQITSYFKEQQLKTTPEACLFKILCLQIIIATIKVRSNRYASNLYSITEMGKSRLKSLETDRHSVYEEIQTLENLQKTSQFWNPGDLASLYTQLSLYDNQHKILRASIASKLENAMSLFLQAKLLVSQANLDVIFLSKLFPTLKKYHTFENSFAHSLKEFEFEKQQMSIKFNQTNSSLDLCRKSKASANEMIQLAHTEFAQLIQEGKPISLASTSETPVQYQIPKNHVANIKTWFAGYQQTLQGKTKRLISKQLGGGDEKENGASDDEEEQALEAERQQYKKHKGFLGTLKASFLSANTEQSSDSVVNKDLLHGCKGPLRLHLETFVEKYQGLYKTVNSNISKIHQLLVVRDHIQSKLTQIEAESKLVQAKLHEMLLEKRKTLNSASLCAPLRAKSVYSLAIPDFLKDSNLGIHLPTSQSDSSKVSKTNQEGFSSNPSLTKFFNNAEDRYYSRLIQKVPQLDSPIEKPLENKSSPSNSQQKKSLISFMDPKKPYGMFVLNTNDHLIIPRFRINNIYSGLRYFVKALGILDKNNKQIHISNQNLKTILSEKNQGLTQVFQNLHNVQMLKFGHPVDLDVLEKLVISEQSKQLKAKKKHRQAIKQQHNLNKTLAIIQDDSFQQLKTTTELNKKMTEKINSLTKVIEENTAMKNRYEHSKAGLKRKKNSVPLSQMRRSQILELVKVQNDLIVKLRQQLDVLTRQQMPATLLK